MEDILTTTISPHDAVESSKIPSQKVGKTQSNTIKSQSPSMKNGTNTVKDNKNWHIIKLHSLEVLVGINTETWPQFHVLNLKDERYPFLNLKA